MTSPRRSDYNPVELTTPDEQHYSGEAVLRPNISMPEHFEEDGYSYSSHGPFADSSPTLNMYPPSSLPPQSGKRIRISSFPAAGKADSPSTSDTERGAKSRRHSRPFHVMNEQGNSIGSSRNSSWDLLAGVRKWEESVDQFDSRHASEKHLAFAEGDIPKNKVRALPAFRESL